MGVIQGAASGLAQTGLGAAVAVKHLNQQKENLAESKNTAERALINAGMSLNDKAAQNTIALDKSEIELGEALSKEANAEGNVKALEKSYNEGLKTGNFTDPKGKPTNAQNAIKHIMKAHEARVNAKQFREHKELEQAALLQQRDFIKQQQGALSKAGLQVNIPLTNRELKELEAAKKKKEQGGNK